MVKKIIAVLLLCAILTSSLAACDIPFFSNGATLFIYMCGSNLESKQGLASKAIDELLEADAGDLNIVIQTGGAKQWRGHDISERAAGRYEIKDGALVELDTLDQLNMGEAQTLADFLSWGQEQYNTSRNMLVLWDHGNGAPDGVCFDENFVYDGLTLSELHTALSDAKLRKKFDLIGFDACLLASIETAAAVKDFAKFMVASEEIEPAGGWDFKAMAESFSAESDPAKVGETICYSYMDKCDQNGKSLMATLSVFDMQYADEMLKWCDFAAEILDDYADRADYASTIYKAIEDCEKFGGDNAYQGAANMLDFMDFFQKASDDMQTNTVEVYLTADKFISFMVCGKGHPGAWGLSFYYPMVYDKEEIKEIIGLNISDNYSQYLSNYFLNLPDKTVEFTDKGSITDEGAFTVSLTPESKAYLSHIDYILMQTDDSGTRRLVCTDNDITKDWDNLVFKSNFRGITLALDGHPIFYSTVSSNETFVSFTTPIMLNGESNTLRFAFFWDDSYFNGGYYATTGVWYGYDENGLPDNNIIPLQPGDRVQIVTDVVQNGKAYDQTYGEEIVIGEDGGKITEVPLDGKEYQYVYAATDMYGNTFFSDMATLEMTVSYDELLENPLPNRTFAAKVTDIQPYSESK